MASAHKYTKLLEHLKIPNSELLGQGMEGLVFDFSDEEVLKIWFRGNELRLTERKKLYEQITSQLSIPIPGIYKIGMYNDISYTIERKISGHPGHRIYLTSSEQVQKKLLDNYFGLLKQLESVSITGMYGQLISDSHEKIQTKSWREFIQKKLQKTLDKSIQKPNHNIENLEQLFNKFYEEELPKIKTNVTKHLVHGDLFLENIMSDESGEITGLLDFGSLSLVGDHLLDVATLTYAATVTKGIDEKTENYLLKKTIQNYPNDTEIVRVYVLYYCLFFINNLTHDPRTYKWCIRNLQKFGYIN